MRMQILAAGVSRTIAVALVVSGVLITSTASCVPRTFKKGRGGLFDFATEGKVRVRMDRVPLFLGPFKNRGPKMDVLSIFAKRDANPSFGFLLVNHELWRDFEVGVSVGQFNPKLDLPDDPGFACLELDGRDTDPLEFYSNCVTFGAAGATVFGAMRGNDNLGTLDLPNAERVDLRFVTVGTEMRYQAREFRVGQFQTYATVSLLGKDFALLPSVGANNLARRTGFSFAFPFLDENGSPPARDEFDLDVRIADNLFDANDDLFCACISLRMDDPEQALSYMTDADDHLADAETLALTLNTSRNSRRILKFLDGADFSLTRALRNLDKGRPAKRIENDLGRALERTGGALNLTSALNFGF